MMPQSKLKDWVVVSEGLYIQDAAERWWILSGSDSEFIKGVAISVLPTNLICRQVHKSIGDWYSAFVHKNERVLSRKSSVNIKYAWMRLEFTRWILVINPSISDSSFYSVASILSALDRYAWMLVDPFSSSTIYKDWGATAHEIVKIPWKPTRKLII